MGFTILGLNNTIKIHGSNFSLPLQSIEVERKKNQLARREFESTIIQKESELYSIGQMIKVADREKSILDLDSEDRVKLSIKKTELENLKKKHRKM